MDSGVLLNSGIADMIAFVADPNPANESLCGMSLMGIFWLKPRMPEKAIKGFVGLLESKTLPEETIGAIVAALVSAPPSDADLVRMLLARAKRFEDPRNSIPLIRWFGLESSNHSNPETLAFVTECLDNKDSRIREAAVETAGRLPAGARSSLMYRLRQISRDESESKTTWSSAAAALR